MATKKILYYGLNNEIKEEEKIIQIPLKSGCDFLEQNINEYLQPLLLNKFIKMKIFPYTCVANGTINTLYFENKEMCKLLSKNNKLHELNTPKLILNKLDLLISKIDDDLSEISNYSIKIYDIEHKIINFIEKYRKNKHQQLVILYSNITNIKKITNEIFRMNYHELLELYIDIVDLRNTCGNSNINILEIILELSEYEAIYNVLTNDLTYNLYKLDNNILPESNKIKIKKIYNHINDRINLYAKTFNINV